MDKHSSQLIRYFNSTLEAKFAILTNGILYKFYTDLDNANVMDEKPFLTLDMSKLRHREIAEVSKFRRDILDVNNILNSAEELKYTGLVKAWMVAKNT